MKKFILIAPFLILLLLVTTILAAFYHYNKKNSITNKLQNGLEVVLPQFSLPELYDSGKNFSNQDLKGKYSLINIFASWCSNCLAEHNLLMKLARANKIAVYGIAWRDIDQNTKNYLEKNGNPYLKIGVDNKGIFSKLLSVSGTPESFLIDPDGRIILYWRGPIDKSSIANQLL